MESSIMRKRLDRDIPNAPLRKKTSSKLKSTVGGIRFYSIGKNNLEIIGKNNVSKPDYEPYICMVYSVISDSYSKTVHDWKVRELGNSKQKRPCHSRDLTILKHQEMLLSANRPPQEVYDLLLDESGSAMQSKSTSQEPRNLK